MVDQAEIHRKSLSGKLEDRREAARQIRNHFADLPDKDAAWQDLIRLTADVYSDVRRVAVYALASAFPAVPDKDGAWQDLHRLTAGEDWFVRLGAVQVLGAVFSAVPDKDGAWQVLHQLTADKDRYMRYWAAQALGSAFSAVHDKDGAWQDLHRLTDDKYSDVRRVAAYALGSAFSVVPDKDGAWQDLIRLTADKDGDVQSVAAYALGSAFSAVPDKDGAWQDLHRLTNDEDSSVRWAAAEALGAAFPAVPDKDGAWQDLHRLTEDEYSDVRVSSNYSLGRASIFNATETECEEDFRRELENALQYFEKSAAEAEYYNPVKFCLLFYRSFHIISFKEAYSETELNGFLNEAKNIAKGSKNRAKLLEIIEQISQAQKEARSAQEMGVDAMKCYLNIYRKHCERASDLLSITEETAPIATKLIRKRTSIIDQEIRETIKAVLDAVEAKRVPESELQGTLNAIQQTLSEIQRQELRGPVTPDDVEHLSKVVDDARLSAADKLKVTLPLIPYFLQYEHVISLEKGINLSSAWDRLVGWTKKRK